jgi:uncharacterized membrane protein
MTEWLLTVEGVPFTTTIVGVVTATATLVIAVGGVITALTVFLPMFRQVKQVHTIVNQQQTDLRNYQAALIIALKEGGVKVPIDQSAPQREVPDGQ